MLLAWVGFIAVTLALVFIGPLILDAINRYEIIRRVFNAVYALGLLAAVMLAVWMSVRFLFDVYKDNK